MAQGGGFPPLEIPPVLSDLGPLCWEEKDRLL